MSTDVRESTARKLFVGGSWADAEGARQTEGRVSPLGFEPSDGSQDDAERHTKTEQMPHQSGKANAERVEHRVRRSCRQHGGRTEGICQPEQ